MPPAAAVTADAAAAEIAAGPEPCGRGRGDRPGADQRRALPAAVGAAGRLDRVTQVDTGNKTRGPLLVIAGGHDHTVPAAISRATRKLYHKSPAVTDLREFNDRGHSLTIDHGWREIADEVLAWLAQRLPKD